MKKLRLDDLVIESFETVHIDEEEEGTIHGHSGILSECICSVVNCSATCGPFTCSGSYDYTFCEPCDTINDMGCG